MRLFELLNERNQSAEIEYSEDDVTQQYEKRLKKSYKGKAKSHAQHVKKTAGRYNVEIVDDFNEYTGRSY